MQQLEIQFFWPLVEQIPLDLDLTPCEEYRKEQLRKSIFGTVSVLNGGVLAGGYGDISASWINPNTTLSIRPENSIGSWVIDGGTVEFGLKKKPNWLTRLFTKLYFNWDWKDK